MLSPATFPMANGVEDTVSNNRGEQLLNEESQQYTANSSKVEVVDQEKPLKLEGFAVAHQLASTENDEVVYNDEDQGRLQRGHGRFPPLEPKIIGRVAYNGFKSFAEDWP